MMKDNLEHHSGDDEACEHDGTGELCPPPGGQVDAAMMVTTSSVLSVIKLLMTMTRASVTVADGFCVSTLKTKRIGYLILGMRMNF